MDSVRTPRSSSSNLRLKRSNPIVSVFLNRTPDPVYSLVSNICLCTEDQESECQLIKLHSLISPTARRERCFCLKNNLTNLTSNCYPDSGWVESLCKSCVQETGLCDVAQSEMTDTVHCVCHKPEHLCITVPTVIDFNSSETSVIKQRSPRQAKSRKDKLYFTYYRCDCMITNDNCTPIVGEKAEKDTQTESDLNYCLCFYDIRRLFTKVTRVFKDCIPVDQWRARGCKECNEKHICEDNTSHGRGDSGSTPCLCNDKKQMCIEETDGITPPWPSTTTTAASTTTEKDDTFDFDKAQGLANMTDSVAISTRAKENLVFAASSLNTSTKIAMSYTARELLKKCSFSGHQCDIDDDFKLYVDPTYGNCYTFNSNTSAVAGSSRAGPFYGLRVQLFLNTSDYLPTTEAAGVRLATHPQGEQPFPDTAGYSAPPGYVSSFGIYLKRVDRLSAPYGNCIGDGKTDKYIYTDSAYTVEGCHRSCLQELVVTNCGCSDPRFPEFPGTTSCSSNDPSKRNCIDDTLASFGGLYGEGRHGCNCREPCSQMVFSVTYSAAQWPASAGQMDCPENMDDKECIEFFKNQGAMIEVYYEELNYQHLEETEAYGWSNLLADFGGQLGLWLGVSVITVIEFIVFIWKIFSMGFKKFRRTVREYRASRGYR